MPTTDMTRPAFSFTNTGRISSTPTAKPFSITCHNSQSGGLTRPGVSPHWAECRCRRLIFTGPIDEFFCYRYGKLPYRSLSFKHVTLNRRWRQSVAVVNYPQTNEYTRVTEYKHLTGQQHSKTSITYEYPSDEGDPYYPVPRPENAELFKRYEALALSTKGVWFVGRLATYRYYNMDQVVGQALTSCRRIDETLGTCVPRNTAGASPNRELAV